MLEGLKEEYEKTPSNKKASFLKKLGKETLLELDTKFPQLNNYGLKTKLFWLFNGLNDFPICPVCGKQFGKDKEFKRLDDKYAECCSRKCLAIKQKERNLKKYGVENVSQLTEVKSKKKETMIKHFGSTENAYIERNKKSKKTISDIDDFYKIRNKKNKETCLKKYGVENVSQLTEVKSKKKETMISNFGSLENAYKERNEKTKKTIAKAPDFYKRRNKKSEKTCLEKYGVKNYGNYIRSKHHYKYILNGFTFDSTDEFAYYLQQLDKNKKIKKSDKVFSFFVDEKEYHYWPDFEVDEKLVEIKGDQFFKNGKMINPYDRSQDLIYEAKYNCMLENNVEILKTSTLDSIKYIEEKFTEDFIPLFKKDLPFPYPNEDLADTSDFGLIHHFHKSIYEANREGKPSPLQAWEDKELIFKTAINRLKYIDRCLPSDILQGFNVTKIAPKVSVFKPKLAEQLIKKYLNNFNEIIDPFSGFSGRLIGSMNCNKKYIGFDINEKHVKESNEIIKFKNFSNCSVKVEDLLKKEKIEKYECLFTCPPYGGKEHWNKDEIEKTCDEWIDICLEKYNCDAYLFVVDKTDKYKDFVVEKISNKSHFSKNEELVVLITKKGIAKFKD